MSGSHPKRSGDVAFRQIEDDMVLVSARTSSVYTLNPVGAFVWEMADGTVSTEDIISAVCATFAVGQSDARVDVQRFLAELADEGIMTGTERP